MTDEILQSDDDALWREDKERHGWVLPAKAAWPLRLPVIRHVRLMVLHTRVHRAAAQWSSVGIGIGGPSAYDRWVLYAVSRGWC